MTREEIKAFAREKLQNKRIILFGAGVMASEFYQEYKDCLNISHCVSNNKIEWGEHAFQGALDIRPYKKEELQADDYLVVCGLKVFREIELQLQADGMKMYEHYIEYRIASAILENKKIALFYGGCVLRDIYRSVIRVPAFREVYASIFSQVVKGEAVITNRSVYYAKDICDLYIYAPRILDRDSIYAVSRDELPDDCKIISISNLVVGLYWPQVSPKQEEQNKLLLYPYNIERDIIIFGHTLYRREDKNISKMVLQGFSTKEIVDCLTSEDFYSEKQVLRNKHICFTSVEMAEKNVDITIMDYLRDNYRTIPLYQNFVHPNKCVIWEYIRRFLKAIGLSTTGLEELEESLPDVAHMGGEVPIYPSVAKHLDLRFIDAQTRYEVMMGNGTEYMTFREYMEHYTEYTRKAIEIIRML